MKIIVRNNGFNKSYLNGVLEPSENSRSMSKSPSWYCAVSLWVIAVSAIYPFSMVLSGVIVNWSPDTTRTESFTKLTLSLPTRISFVPITRPVMGDKTYTTSIKHWRHVVFLTNITCTSVLPIDFPCNILPFKIATFGSATRNNGCTKSVTRNPVLREIK